MKQITVTIDTDGSCQIDGSNFVGTECERFIKEVETTLGTREQARYKPEFRTRQVNKQTLGR
jgi:hypothetical protein